MLELVLFVLDVADGRPVQGLNITLFRKQGDGALETILSGVTEADGCLRVNSGVACTPGFFRAEYQSQAYFTDRASEPTFPCICVDFFWDGTETLVVPLLMSAHGYTVYRGS